MPRQTRSSAADKKTPTKTTKPTTTTILVVADGEILPPSPRPRRTGRPSAEALSIEIESFSPHTSQVLTPPPPISWRTLFQDFINNLTIESKETGETILGQSLWGSQRRVLDEITAGMDEGIRDFTVCKSRQLGETTICLAIDLFWLFMYPGIHGCIVIDEEGNRDKLRVILRQYATRLPRGMRYAIVDDNKTLMSFDVGGKLSILDFIVAGKRKGTLGASRAYRFAHLSEIANYGDEQGLENFLQTLSEGNPDRLFIKESTANGFNHFHTMCESAKRDKLTQRFIFVGWWSRDDQCIFPGDKRYDEYAADPPDEEETELISEVLLQYNHTITMGQLAWYRWRAETRSLDEGMLHQTQPFTERQAFVLSGRSFFPLRKVERDLSAIYEGAAGPTYDYAAYRYYLGQTIDATVLERVFTDTDCELKVWEDPVPWGRYVIGCDPAYGRSDWSDSHAITVCRCYADKLVTVAEWGTPEPETFQVTWALAHLASVYRDCYVNLEVKGPGIVIMTELRRMKQILQSDQFTKIVTAKGWEDVVDGIKWYLWHRPDSLGQGYAYGINTTIDVKMAIMNELRDNYINELLLVKSTRALEQMKYIIQDGPDIGPASKGRKKDDFVFSLAFAHRAWLDWVRPDMVASNYTYAYGQQDDADQRSGHRPSMISGIVGQWFEDRDKDRSRVAADLDPWASKRGLIR